MNLLNNARDAVEERLEAAATVPGRVEMRTTRDGQDVQIEVQDNGAGIPLEVISKVFDPFFTTKDPDKGTGLGLAISRSIVEECGGTLQIHSAPGEGTTVAILLPAADKAPDSA